MELLWLVERLVSGGSDVEHYVSQKVVRRSVSQSVNQSVSQSVSQSVLTVFLLHNCLTLHPFIVHVFANCLLFHRYRTTVFNLWFQCCKLKSKKIKNEDQEIPWICHSFSVCYDLDYKLPYQIQFPLQENALWILNQCYFDLLVHTS